MQKAFTLALSLCVAASGAAVAETAPAGPETPAAILERPLAAAPEPAAEAPPAAAPFRAAAARLPAEERAAVLAFYEARDFAPYWAEDGRAAALAARLAAAADEGLPAARYAALLAAAPAEAGPAREVALTAAYLAAARDLAGGLVEPARVDAEITLSPERPAAAALLGPLGAGDPAAALDTLAPQSADYRALVAEKARLEALAASGGWGASVPGGPVLREGDRDPRVAALRDRLGRLGFSAEPVAADVEVLVPAAAGAPVPEPARPDAQAFDPELAGAVAAFQRAYGLQDDGVVGAQTLAALNASPEDRIGQVLVNLERLRWLGELGERYVLVNIPAFTVAVFDGGERVYHTRSVVGQRATQTPEFSETMTYLVVNPTWYIPDSIARRVYLPQLRQDPSVLRRNNMRLFTRAGTEIDPGLVDFAALEGAFPFRVRQNPSPGNALGRVKFMFPNQFAIYLHDTPARELFDRDARAFSNGCVRLEDPLEFAHYLLAPQLDDPEATFADWVAAGSERYVTLEEPIKVHITYRTAWVDPEAGPQYRADVYGRDAKVLAALAARGVAVPEPRG